MKTLARLLVFGGVCLGLSTLAAVHAEILHAVFPMDSLREVKVKYPNARFSRIPAAWVKPDEAFFVMTGEGFPGELRILFDDRRPLNRQRFAEQCSDWDGTSTEEKFFFCKMYKSAAAASDDDALSVNWVRWSPSQPIPIERYKSKYGEPVFEFSSKDMSPMAKWERFALTAQLSDDQKLVLYVDTTFTKAEWRRAYQDKVGFVPDSLVEATTTPEAKPRPAQAKDIKKTPGGQKARASVP